MKLPYATTPIILRKQFVMPAQEQIMGVDVMGGFMKIVVVSSSYFGLAKSVS